MIPSLSHKILTQTLVKTNSEAVLDSRKTPACKALFLVHSPYGGSWRRDRHRMNLGQSDVRKVSLRFLKPQHAMRSNQISFRLANLHLRRLGICSMQLSPLCHQPILTYSTWIHPGSGEPSHRISFLLKNVMGSEQGTMASA